MIVERKIQKRGFLQVVPFQSSLFNGVVFCVQSHVFKRSLSPCLLFVSHVLPSFKS